MKCRYAVILSVFVLIFALFVVSANAVQANTVFLRDGGVGDGSTYESAVGDFRTAVKLIKDTGGTIVVCGKYTYTELINLSEKSGTSNGKKTITVTSVYGQTDYRKTNSAALCNGNETVSANMILAGEFIFENININTYGSETERYIIANGYKTVFGDGIKCSKFGKAPYISIVSGMYESDTNKNYDLSIKSGTYNKIYASNRNVEHRGNTTLTIDGGSFTNDIVLLGTNNKFDINGGDFLRVNNITLGVSESYETAQRNERHSNIVNINQYSGDVNNLSSKIKGNGVDIKINTAGGNDIAPETQVQTDTAVENTEKNPENITEKETQEQNISETQSQTNKKQYFFGTKNNTVLAIIILVAIIFSASVLFGYRMVHRRK